MSIKIDLNKVSFVNFKQKFIPNLTKLAEICYKFDKPILDYANFYHLQYGDSIFFSNIEFDPERDINLAFFKNILIGVCGTIKPKSLNKLKIIELWGPLILPIFRNNKIGLKF